MQRRGMVLVRLKGDIPFNFLALSSDSVMLIRLLDSAPMPNDISRIREFEVPEGVTKEICYKGRRKLIWVTVP